MMAKRRSLAFKTPTAQKRLDIGIPYESVTENIPGMIKRVRGRIAPPPQLNEQAWEEFLPKLFEFIALTGAAGMLKPRPACLKRELRCECIARNLGQVFYLIFNFS